MAWMEIGLPLLSAVVILFIPGLVIGVTAGFRGLTLLGLAPVTSTALIALTAMVAPFAHVKWGWLPLSLVTIVVALIIGLLRFLLRGKIAFATPQLVARANPWPWIIGLAVAAVVITWRLTAMVGDPTNISQTFDNVFHLNAVRYVLDSGNASSLTLADLNPHGHFYPGAWHALTSLVVMTSHTTIPIAVNAVTIAIAAIVWPLSTLFALRVFAGAQIWMMLGTGLLATAFAAYPYLMFDYGVLYPFGLGLALVAPVWALSAMAWRLHAWRSMSSAMVWIMLAIASFGVALAHPSALIVVLLLNFAFAAQQAYRLIARLRVRGAGRGPYFAITGGFVAAIALTGFIIFKIRPGNFWMPQVTWPQAVGELALGGPVGLQAALLLSIVVIVGVVIIVRTRATWWLGLSWLLFAGLFLVAAAERVSAIRSGLIGVWYGDTYRMAAILVVVAMPVAALGLNALAQRVTTFVGRRLPRFPVMLTTVLVFVIALVGLQASNVSEQIDRGKRDYDMTASSPLLTPDEYQLLNEVDQYVPEGITVGGNPWTGTALVYAIANRPSLFEHVLYTPTADQTRVVDSLQNALTDPLVCESVRHLHLGYILDFGTAEVHGERHIYPGFENLTKNPAVTRVTSVGPASLWKITACGAIS